MTANNPMEQAPRNPLASKLKGFVSISVAEECPPLARPVRGKTRAASANTAAAMIGGDGDVGFADSAIVALHGGLEEPGGESSAAVPVPDRVVLRVTWPPGGEESSSSSSSSTVVGTSTHERKGRRDTNMKPSRRVPIDSPVGCMCVWSRADRIFGARY